MTKITQTKTLNLALQGGGSYGTFMWGVLDALLEDQQRPPRHFSDAP
ncbi:MAG TPA: hypothetical protein PK513_07530 [Alphaproteobacteria bacterium]|nr:hypothetical protein [Alphaproteobacteria bacterium]HOO82335.1 hypothetical protein [Alphaproteobacteria bacterium]